MFAYLYVHQIVRGRMNSLSGVTRFVTTDMDVGDQVQLFHELKGILQAKGLL